MSLGAMPSRSVMQPSSVVIVMYAIAVLELCS
jgi:hypothetical protein